MAHFGNFENQLISIGETENVESEYVRDDGNIRYDEVYVRNDNKTEYVDRSMATMVYHAILHDDNASRLQERKKGRFQSTSSIFAFNEEAYSSPLRIETSMSWQVDLDCGDMTDVTVEETESLHD